jgi:prepilin-type N-terminal cleavage/methylation domain-containing protein
MTSNVRRRDSDRGFTLVELSAVVAIVGILSVIALVGYRRITLSAKLTEAQNMISGIRIAEEDVKTERERYMDMSGGGYCPSAGNTGKKWAWNPGCGTSTTDPGAKWEQLPVHADGPVEFGYIVYAGPAFGAAPAPANWVAFTGAPAGVPYYVIHAKSDLDRAAGLETELVGTSFQNTIFSRYEGE